MEEAQVLNETINYDTYYESGFNLDYVDQHRFEDDEWKENEF